MTEQRNPPEGRESTRGVGRGLFDSWKDAQQALEAFLVEIGADQGASTVAILFIPQKISSPKDFADVLRPQIAGDGLWNVATTRSEDGARQGYALPVTRDHRSEPLAFLLAEAHSMLGAWWLVSAWRAQELAKAAALLADRRDTVAAAACVRPLIETAAATWNDARKLASVWDEMKKGGVPSSNQEFPLKRQALLNLLIEVHFGGKFDERAPDEREMWGQVQRSNVLGHIEKLRKAGCTKLQSDYQWLCNTVHPSLGNMFAYSAPPQRHNTETHLIKFFCGRPIHIVGPDGTVDDDRTVQIATARGATVALRVLQITLDAALRVVDDLALTSEAPGLVRQSYWRRLSVGNRNDPCPCRSGQKVKHCPHEWGQPGPSIPDRFSVKDLLPIVTSPGPGVN